MPEFVCLNGQILEREHAAIDPADGGFLHGVGLFETMRVINGRVFRLREHIDRMADSCQTLQLPAEISQDALAGLIAELLEANGLTDARVRLTVTAGHPRNDDSGDNELTVLISTQQFGPYPPEVYERGMETIVCPYMQNPMQASTGHKTTSYLDRLLALRFARRMQAGEALWFTTPHHALAEGCISNAFIITAQGILATAPLTVPDDPARRMVLPGITRQCVLDICQRENLPCQQRLISLSEVQAAREIFLTNAVMGVMPVTKFTGRPTGEGQPGELTRKIAAHYDAMLRENA